MSTVTKHSLMHLDAMFVFQCASGDSPFLGFCRVSGTRGVH